MSDAPNDNRPGPKKELSMEMRLLLAPEAVDFRGVRIVADALAATPAL